MTGSRSATRSALAAARAAVGAAVETEPGTPDAEDRSAANERTASPLAERVPIGRESVPPFVAQASHTSARLDRPGGGAATAGTPLRLAHTDWLHHRLEVSGPCEPVAAFQAAACGAGVVPWQLDLDRMEEDLFLLLAAPPPPQRRRLSLAGARVLAGQLRDAVAARQEAAASLVGRSRACPLDLHALVPLPPEVLRLGPDHPDALAWLWAQWGATAALRHVAVAPAPALRTPVPAGIATVRFTFWSADWTPWRALAVVAARWPAVRFELRPSYGVL